MKFTSIIITCIVALLIASCGTKKVAQADTSQNALDWNGNYVGSVSENDNYFEMQIQVKTDNSYELVTSSIDGNGKNNYQSGKFKWIENGRIIQLDNKLPNLSTDKLLVGENSVYIVRDIATQYDFSKLPKLEKSDLNDLVIEKYWKLTVINGKSVTSDDFFGKEPHMILKKEFNAVKGNDGCNGFFGSYKLNGNAIKFEKMVSTMMACPESFVFENFHRILQQELTFEVNEEQLMLKSQTDNLTFQVVYL